MPLPSGKKRVFKIITYGSVFFIGIIIYILYFLPLPDSILGVRSYETTKIYDRNGVLLYEVLRPEEGRQTKLSFARFPKNLINATLSAEDSNYYSHWGVDIGAVFRSIWLNVKNQEIVSGASTIPQQLIRNLLGTTRDRSFSNKMLESLYALRFSNMTSKDDILERYLNTIFYGNISYGAEAAALNYFGKHIYDLDLAEITLLSGIPKNPSLYNPLTHFDDAKERQKEVLDRMVENKIMSKEEAETVFQEKIIFATGNKKMKAPHFVMYVLDELEKELGKETLLYGGLKIKTTLDIYMQEEAERIVQKHVKSLADKNVTNGAVFVVDKEGEILAMVGSKDYYDQYIDGQVNVVLRKRQPGSTFKPITYLAAFQKGWTPATTIQDIPIKFMTEEGTPYTPKNYDMDYHGLVTVREALANSYNIPAVKALEFAGIPHVLTLAQSLGITSLDKDAGHYGLALTLGDGEVRLFELVQAFQVLANKGIKKPLRFFNSNEESLQQENRIIPENIVSIMTNILSDNTARMASFGENSSLNIKNIAAKTGTSRNSKDNWTVGYSPDFIVGVWVGNNDASSMHDISGIDGAGPIFHDMVMEMIKMYGNKAFDITSDIIEKEICLPSGKLSTDICPQKRKEIFMSGTEPTEKDILWQQKNGKLVLSLPPELHFWAKQKGYPVLTEEAVKNYLHIQNPQDLDEFYIDTAIPRNIQKTIFRAAHSSDIQNIEWFLNGKLIGKGEELPWMLQEGNFVITAKSGTVEDRVAMSVISKK